MNLAGNLDRELRALNMERCQIPPEVASRSHLSRIFSGEREVSIQKLEKIAQFLGIPSICLITEDEELSSIIKKWKKVPAASRLPLLHKILSSMDKSIDWQQGNGFPG